MCGGRICHVFCGRIGGRSYSSTADTLLAFYTNKTKQHLHKPIVALTYMYLALMKGEALLTI